MCVLIWDELKLIWFFNDVAPPQKKKESIRRLYKQNYNFIHIVSQQPVLPLHQQHTLAASLQPGSLGTNNIDYFVKLVWEVIKHNLF